jgi:hypothetical protein
LASSSAAWSAACFSTLGNTVMASRNSQHLSLRFVIVQFGGTDPRLVGAVAQVLGIIRPRRSTR